MDGVRPLQFELALKPGDVLGRHELLMPVAKGGMGQVWAARLHGTRGFQKLVAIKTILPSGEDAGNLESMLFEEASLAALVRHPNVVETLDLGERDDGTMYLVMEWVAGEPLDHILHAAIPVGGVPTWMLVHFGIQALSGLRAVHEACNARGEPLGIVHRDVSPQNLMVTCDGVVKLIDFGIAKATQQMSRQTEEGMVKGKFAYMSPEHLRSEPLDARADLFSLGVVLYRATTGEHPFQGANLAATMRNILMAAPQRPAALVPGYSAALEEVILKALSKDRSERFGSAQEMMVALEQAVPEARASGMGKQCEVFLRQLFEDRMAQRTRALQLAMTAADEARGVTTGDRGPRYVRSQSTMRAVSREMVAEESGPPGPPEPSSHEEESLPRGDPATRRAIRSVLLAGAVGALLLVGLVGSRGLASSHAGHPGAGSAVSPNVREAPSVPSVLKSDISKASEIPMPQPQLVPAALPSVSPSAAASPSAINQARPVPAPKKRTLQLPEPAPLPTATGAVQARPEAGPATTVDVDPLSRRR